MTKFFTWLDDVCRKAKKSKPGKVLMAAGFTVYHTGGGCLAWRKDYPGKVYVLLTDDVDGANLNLDESDDWLIGIYRDDDVDGEPLIEDATAETVAGAIKAADEAVAKHTAKEG
jgi:hypothetical protein